MNAVHDHIPTYPGPTSRKFMQLPPIQTSFAVNPPQRAQPPNPDRTIRTESPPKLANATTETPPPKQRTSRGGILALFRWKKVAKSSEIHEELDTTEKGAQGLRRPTSRGAQASHNTMILPTSRENAAAAPSSRTLRRQSSKPRPKSKSLKKELRIRTPTTWDPPPLFQAYPQAIKFASLRAPIVSTDAILGSNNEKENTNTRQNSKPANVDIKVAERRTYFKRKLKRTSAEPIPKEDWTRNLYVLITSGYFLQYAGEGSFDRLPEKVMALSKESAAFASDAISGEHWVLQISRFSDEDGVKSDKDQGSIMKKIGFQRDTKRSDPSFLLVLDSPEEMDSWLRVVRGWTESMGGKKYHHEAGACDASENAGGKGDEKLSHRYSMRSDAFQYSRRRWEPAAGLNFRNAVREERGLNPAIPLSPTSTMRKRSIGSQLSVDSPAHSNSTVSINQIYLDHLRGSHTFSYASTGAKTLSTSRGSSPRPSPRPVPAKPHFSSADHASSLDEGATPIPELPVYRRASTQRSLRTSVDTNIASRSNSRSESRSPRPVSMRRSPSRQYTPPSAPNFSIPAFAKRNSTVTRGQSSSTDQASKPLIDDTEPSRVLSVPAAELRTEAKNPFLPLPHSSSSHELSLLPPKDERPLPRRLSTFQYSRGIQPRHLLIENSLPPHPPPRSALPAVPTREPRSDQSAISSHSSESRQLGRPLSMQVRSDPVKLLHHRLPHSISEDKQDFDSPSQPLREFLPRPDRCALLHPAERSKIRNRRSMPEIDLLAPLPNFHL